MRQVIFKKPPVIEVGISVQFPNTLEVADGRSRFHRRVKADFPQAVIPEQSKLAFDFGDYALYTQNLADRLEIGMSYFRFVSTSYLGFATFRTMFLSQLSVFREVYELDAFNDFFYYYNNRLPMRPQQAFEECFTLEVRVPESFQGRFFSGQGVLLFQEPEGFVAVELRPEWKENEIVEYNFNLRFGAHRQIAFSGGRDELAPLVEVGHTHLKNYFLSLLQQNFIEMLEKQ